MRIFVIEPDGSGGLMHYAFQLCTALADQGASVTLVTSHHYEMADYPHNFEVAPILRLWLGKDGDAGKARSKMAARAHRAYRKLRRVYRGAILFREWVRLTHYLAKQRPDIVQFSVLRHPAQAAAFGYLNRRGLILTQLCHEFERRQVISERHHRIERLFTVSAYESFRAIFFLAEHTRQSFLTSYHYPPQQTHVVEHGNQEIFVSQRRNRGDARKRYGLSPDRPIVLFFGNVDPSKGIPELLEAFSRVPSDLDACLIVAGYPSKFIDMDELNRFCRELGLWERVIFDARYLPMQELCDLLECCSLSVFPYRTAVQSGALQLAYSFTCPVVATAVGGLSEVVEHEGSGLLVPPQDIEALTEALVRLLREDEQRQKMGTRARELSLTTHAWAPIAATIMETYRGLIEQGPKPRI